MKEVVLETRSQFGKSKLAVIITALIAIFAISASAQQKLAFEEGDTLDEIRAKIEHNGYKFTVGETWVYKLSAEEKAKMFRVKEVPPPEKRKIAPFTYLTPSKKAPAAFDWRSYNGHSYVGPIHNQGNIGSCYSFGANACAETTYNFKNGLYDGNCVDFSESYIVWTLGSTPPYNQHFGGGGGADYEYYELYALTQAGPPEGATGIEGVCSEANFPYTETQPSQATIDQSKTFPRVTFKQWGRVYPANYNDTTEQIKTAISTYGAVDAAVYVTNAFQAYTGGIYEDGNTEPDNDPYYYTTTNHAIALVGWNDADQAWILRNSWGTGWGESGYMRIKYFNAAVNTAVAYLEAEGQAGQFSISGTISGDTQSGVLVSVTGAGSGTATSAQDGTYTVTGLADGNYTVTPSKSGYTFTPASQTVTIAGANQPGVNFTATQVATYSISGKITLANSSSLAISEAQNEDGKIQFRRAENKVNVPSKRGQKASAVELGIEPLLIMADPNVNNFKVLPPASVISKEQKKTATISIQYLTAADQGYFGDVLTDWPNDAKAAFSYAASIWENILTSSVPVTIKAGWVTNLPQGALGHGGALNFFRNFTNAPKSDTWYQASLANSLAGQDIDPGEADIYIGYSSNFTWYYGTDGNCPQDMYDLVSVAAHEIAHGLGFAGSMSVNGGVGSYGFGTGYPCIYDSYAINGAGQSLVLDFANNSADLAAQLTSNNLFFNGNNAKAANGGTAPGLFAPAQWMQGSSFSHLAEIFNNTPDALMTYSIGYGEVIHSAGPVIRGLMKDIGWTVGGGGGGGGLAGVVVSDGTRTATTDANGDYVITGVPAGTYTITPSKSGYNFTPATRSVTVTGNVTGCDFTASQGGGTASITVTSPVGGEIYSNTDVCPIRWTSQGVTGDVLLEVLISGNSVGSATTANDGVFDWQITTEWPASSEYQVKISSQDGTNVSGISGFFTITGGGGDNNPPVTIGSTFTLDLSEVGTFDKKPSIYALINGKKKAIKVTTKSQDFDGTTVNCEWKIKCVEGDYDICAKGKISGNPFDDQIGVASVMSPTIADFDIDGNLDTPGSTIHVEGMYFGVKPKIWITYNCDVCGQPKPGKKSCKFTGIFDKATGESSFNVVVPKFKAGSYNRVLYIDSGCGKDSCELE